MLKLRKSAAPKPPFLAYAVEAGLNELPPTIAKLIEAAPESFDDLRRGQIGDAIKTMRARRDAVYSLSVAQKSGQFGLLISELGGALPRELAEIEAGIVWQAYEIRRAQSIFDEAGNSLRSSPGRARTICETALRSLSSLTARQQQLAERLDGTRYNPEAHLIKPAPVYSIGRTAVCTDGNLTTVSAQAKTGKTAVLGGMMASTFAGDSADCLGFASQNPDGGAVVHIDTEQSPYDHCELVRRIEKRAGQSLPDWLRSYCLTGWTANDIRQAIPVLIATGKKDCGSVHSVLLDGSADAVFDVNDPAESNGFVAELHALAIKFKCPLVCVIHLNPGSEFKTRGHLGSQLERKAETNLKAEKDGDEIITLWAEKNRHAPILKKNGPRFTWDNQSGMHVSIESAADANADLVHEELSGLFKSAMNGRLAMSFSDLKLTVMRAVTVKDRTAERKIALAVTLGILRKTHAGLYESSL